MPSDDRESIFKIDVKVLRPLPATPSDSWMFGICVFLKMYSFVSF